jgi:hypothetical protein
MAIARMLSEKNYSSVTMTLRVRGREFILIVEFQTKAFKTFFGHYLKDIFDTQIKQIFYEKLLKFD